MPGTAADLCEMLDRIARTPDGERVLYDGYAIYGAALEEGLVEAGPGHDRVGYWVGELVRDGRMGFRSRGGGIPPLPAGVTWNATALGQHYGYYLTESGRRDAAETRALRRRVSAVDELLSGRFSPATTALDPEGIAAVSEQVAALRQALETARYAAAIGAARELVESAARAALAFSGPERGARHEPARAIQGSAETFR